MHASGTCIQVCFGAKEIQDRRTVLSERAVLIRVHRINAATSERSAGTKTKTGERLPLRIPMRCPARII
ncbi:MAG: hypothetical protein DMG54_02320 [Acidobacteria bacterium]|nr:MAG: hypothetical protein DMG54_02320 [Acidobacteriota bacterium]